MNNLIYLAPVAGIIAVIFAFIKATQIGHSNAGNDKMKEISDAIAEGARAFLFAEYKILIIFVAILFVVLGVGIDWLTAVCFIIGAVLSTLAGYVGMNVATKANVRTANAAKESGMNKALSIAFAGGAVMGLCVVGFGILGLSVILIIVMNTTGFTNEAVSILTGFSLGASSIALFARVGGGIYTKAADVGADLVGKVEAGIPEMCAALDHLYYDSKNESIIESLTQVLQCNPKILLAKELLGYTYYNMQMLGNALSYFEQFEDGKPTSRIFLEGTVYFWMAWCYGKKKDCLKEEEYYRKSLEALPVGENTLNNLGYSLYKQRKFKEAQSVFEDCLRQNRDVRYAANNLVRTLLAQGKNGEAQRVIQEHERFVSKDLKKRAEKPVGKVKIAVPEPAVTDVEAETIVDIGVKKQQFSSEKLLEDELVQRMEIGIPVFGMPLRIYQKRGVYGRQFVLRNGRLDILGIDTAGDLYVIELKKDSGYDDAYAQTREYIDWIEEDVAVKGQRVFGIICLNDPTKDLIEKVKADDQMRLFEYSISYSEII